MPAAFLKRYEVAETSSAEQRRIADILEKADAIRRKRKESIALNDEVLRSTFLGMFGDPVTNSKEWPIVPLTELATVVTGNTPSRARSEFFGDAIEWIKSDNINTDRHILTPAREGLSALGRSVARAAPAGSTLMTCIAGSPECIGNVGLADREVAFNQQINALTPLENVDYRFLYTMLWLGKRKIQASSTESMKGMVSKGRLEAVEFPRPLDRLQRTFGRIFDRLLLAESDLRSGLDEAEYLFGALVHRAFRGELTA